MQRWRDVTVGDLIDGIKRYQPFLATIAVIALIATVLPGRGDGSGENVAASGPRTQTESQVEGTQVERVDTDLGTDGDAQSVREAAQAATVSDDGQLVNDPGAFEGASDDETFVPGANCDPQTGRIAVPSLYAPPCAPAFEGDNGGATAQGVEGDKVIIAAYIPQLDPATGAILSAIGADDDPDDLWETYQDYKDYFQTHYETYGREIELLRIDGGQPDDDVAAQANAQEIIDAGAFLSLDGPTDTNVYMRMLADAGIICICTVSQPINTYLDHQPYVWSTLMSSSQLYVHRAEFVGKRLWGDLAEHAGQADFQISERTFALVYFDTAEGTYTEGANFFERELKEKYGAELADRIAVTGAHVDTAGAQREAPTVAQRLKDNKITSVVFAGDPLYPIFLTKEATNKQYFPEWIITGSVLSDTTLFGRTYDQLQWRNAFGVSALSARFPEELQEAFRIHVWHHGREPTANAYALRYNPFWIAATGVHMAGPNLTVGTFRDGLFAYPPSGGGPTAELTSFGTRLWQWVDYLRYDDMTEIWWDPEATGEDELGARGVGMYRYVDGGKRYLPGEWPTSAPKAFVRDGTVTVYDEAPPGDEWPEYEPYHEQN